MSTSNVEEYSVFGRTVFMYDTPKDYDRWGFNEKGEQWQHSFCVMDDFGNATPIDPFIYQEEGYKPFLAPDYDPETPVGQPYKYIQYAPLIH